VDLLRESASQLGALLLHADPEVLRVIALSLQISLTATAFSVVVGVPLGTWLALSRFPGRRFLLGLVHTGMGMPPVVVGLLVTLLLWRSGPLGSLRLLYTPTAIGVAQFLLAAPIVAGLSAAAIQQLNPLLRLQIVSLGATPWQQLWLLTREARLPLLAATMAAFGAVVSEVGAAMMVGGNIAGYTRVLTTATVLETSKGNFALALALGLILLALMYAVNLSLTWVQQRGRPLRP
jgi:tungstate transport system permease protein